MRLTLFRDYGVNEKFVRHGCDVLKHFISYILFILCCVEALKWMTRINKRIMQVHEGIAATCGFKSAKSGQREISRAVFTKVQIAGFIQKNEQCFSFVVAHYIPEFIISKFNPPRFRRGCVMVGVRYFFGFGAGT